MTYKHAQVGAWHAGGEGRFDILPLVLQASPTTTPEMFTIPQQYIAEVPILHPKHTWVAQLGLRWYAVPAVSNIELSIGGITYTAVPFNGW